MSVWLISVAVLSSSCSVLHRGEDEINHGEDLRGHQATAETDFHLSPIPDVSCVLFVAPDGDDDNVGSKDLPLGSFECAADKVQPGDTVCFREGVYQTEDIHLTTSGQLGGIITFAAFPNGRPILDGGGSPHELLVVNQGVSFVRISRFQLRGFQIPQEPGCGCGFALVRNASRHWRQAA